MGMRRFPARLGADVAKSLPAAELSMVAGGDVVVGKPKTIRTSGLRQVRSESID
jgi:hypothetical protein